ncbi:hypothetical protein M378DRAFT_161257 [Amanita muscaria Koide BX008]|uniref:GPI-anchored wall transfer protein n=1 Tax=Amanita muscaria (strain Koide BX008) TaxID=946122 RepID=A0A0C2WW75_AMAMK|nr:hypothetical protein M378DRAFT_161257 [Amanita muscaria Koide BX008]
MVDDSDYKKAKEAFVTGMTGTTMFHIHSVSLVALASVALYAALATRGIRLNLSLSWLILVAPLLFSMTAFADSPYTLFSLFAVPAALIVVLFPRREEGTPLPSALASPTVSRHIPVDSNRLAPLPALTTYRAHMMLMTILAILAVDFPIFPRAFAKCETFGISLMDLGVGSFVFSQGVVSALPILKHPNYLTSPFFPKLLSTTRKTFPIIVLGLIRVLLVKATDYPEHVSEYGVHWNFFLTLALLPVLQVVLHPLILRTSVSLLSIIVAIAQQVVLSYGGLQDYVLNAPRTSLVSANKEGIVSLPGYLAIHLLGLSIGTLILPPSPSWFRRMIKLQREAPDAQKSKRTDERQSANALSNQIAPLSSPRHMQKTLTELCAYALLWSSCCAMLGFIGIGADNIGKEPLGHGLGKRVSRRIVNLPYILWIAAFNTTFLFAYLLLDILFFPTPAPQKIPKSNLDTQNKRVEEHNEHISSSQQQPYVALTPSPLLEAVNRNALALFLLANVCTGVINLSMRTIDASDRHALFILGIYTYSLCFAAWTIRDKRLLKL